MALTKISGSILKDPLNLGEVSIGGTLTYQDVTNVDAIGIGTFRSGINVSDLTDGRVTFASANGRLTDSANLTFDGTTLQVQNSGSGLRNLLRLKNSHASAGVSGLYFNSTTSGTAFDAACVRNGVYGSGQGRLYLQTNNGSGLVTNLSVEYDGQVSIPTNSLNIIDSIVHIGDTNTKIRFPSNDTISFETGGSERLRIRSDGNVGVGSDNPQAEFEVYGYGAAASGATPILAIRNGYAGTANTGNALSSELRFLHKNHNAAHEFMAARILAYTSDNYSQNSYLSFLVAQGNNGTERFRITSAGKISISDDGTTDGWLTIKQNASFNDVPHIRLIDDSDSREAWISNHAGDLQLANGGNDNVPHCYLKLQDGNQMIFATGNTPRLYVNNSGISFSSKLLCTFTVSGSDYVAEFRNNNANSYGVQIKEPSSVNNGYPLLAVDTNSGASHFRVDSGTGNIYANAGSGTGRLAYMCRAWASFTQTGTQTFRGSRGFSSHTDLGTGYTKFTLSYAQPDVNYSIVCSGTAGQTSSGYASLDTINAGGNGTNGPTTNQFVIRGCQNTGSTPQDLPWMTIAVFA